MHIVFFLLALIAGMVSAHSNNVTVSGFVRDSSTGERLINATVFDKEALTGTLTDNNGYFSLKVQTPTILSFSYVGYNKLSIEFNNRTDTLIEVKLVPGTDLSEVVVTAEPAMNPNVTRLSAQELQSIPSITGKPDVMKAMQLMPGVLSQAEGSSLLLVRGGNPGENMYLFDQVPIIYVNHLGGFMSVFNPDIINSLDIYKGSFPSRFGGKLSSIVNITQREGNNSALKGSYHLGITDLSLTFDGPVNDNTTFIFTGRKTLYDLLFLAASSGPANSAYVMNGFHDLNGKISWKPNPRNSFHFNIFQGDDYIKLMAKNSKQNPANKNDISYMWGNWMASTGWKHVASSSLFAENIVSFSRYRLREQHHFITKESEDIHEFKSRFLSSLEMLSLVSAWKYNFRPNWKIDFGLNSTLLLSVPNYTTQTGVLPLFSFSRIPGIETALYAENRVKLGERVELTAGIRGINYSTEGYTVFKGEPRISLQTKLSSNQALSFGFMNVNQFSHLLFTSGSIMNNEVWVPAGKTIKPSSSNQFTMGWMSSFSNNAYQAEINAYYKNLSNLATYKEGFTNLRGDVNWQTKIATGGEGQAYGLEFLVKKNTGKLTGFAGYTWSRATRQFRGINQGQEYRFEFDRPHAVSLALSYNFNKRVSLNTSWVYQTGLPYTPAIGRYLSPSLEVTADELPYHHEVFIYGERNSARMKDYHRLDFSINLNRFTYADRLKATWSFGLYNAYNRKNPVYYYFNTGASSEFFDPDRSADYSPDPFKLYQLSLFPVIPTISYRYYFGAGSMKDRPPFKERFKNWLHHD